MGLATMEDIEKFAVFPSGYFGMVTPATAWNCMMAISA
jgi:hypothetical protein